MPTSKASIRSAKIRKSPSVAPEITGVMVSPSSGRAGTTFTVAATATGSPEPAIQYQWSLDGVPIGGATSATFGAVGEGMLTAVVTASNFVGTDIRETAPIEVGVAASPPAIANADILPDAGRVGDTFTIDATITGEPTPEVSYQWKLNGVGMVGGNASSVTATEEGMHTVALTAWNSEGSIEVEVGSVEVLAAITGSTDESSADGSESDTEAGSAPEITAAEIAPRSASVGDTLTVAVTLAGEPQPGVTHQWKRDGAELTGETGAAYVARVADDGHQITCVVTATNSFGNTSTETAAVLIAYPAPQSQGKLADQTLVEKTGVHAYDAGADFVGEALVFSLPTAPAGMGIDPKSGVVSIDTSATDVLSGADVVVRATNSGGFAESRFGLTVEAAAPFHLPDAFTDEASGLLFDPRQPDTMFQGVDTMPANQGEALGLVLDRSKGTRGKVNILASSADPSDPVWANNGITIEAVGERHGEAGPWHRITSSNKNNRYISQRPIAASGRQAVQSVYVRWDKSLATFQLRWRSGSDAAEAEFSFGSGGVLSLTKTTGAGAPSAGISDLGSGVYRVWVAARTTEDNQHLRIQLPNPSESIQIAGPQVELGEQTTAYQKTGHLVGGPGSHAYQSVGSDRPRLDSSAIAFDGVSSRLLVDLSADQRTDNMTLFAVVTRANSSGVLIGQADGASAIGRYQSGGSSSSVLGAGAPTIYVDGAPTGAKEADLFRTLPAGTARVVEFRGLDLSDRTIWGRLQISGHNGGSLPFAGSLGPVLLMTSAQADAYRPQIMSELSKTWNPTPEQSLKPAEKEQQALTFSRTITIAGDQGQTGPHYYVPSANILYDARGSVHRGNKWRSDGVTPDDAYQNWAFQIGMSNQYGSYWYGGYVVRDDPEGLSFDASYGSDDSNEAKTAVGTSSGKNSNGALFIREGEGSVVVDGLRIHNTHDGVTSGQSGGSDRIIVVKNCYMTHIHDDAVENDNHHNLVIQDNLVDGGFVWFSTRAGGSGDPPDRSASRMITMRRNVVRLKNFPGFPSGDRIAPGHGRIFKGEAQGLDPQIICLDNIFVIESDRENGAFQWGTEWHGYASGNIVIWMGRGSWPYGALPSGFTLVEGDDRAFHAAKASWLAARGWSDATEGGTVNGGSVTAPAAPLSGPYADGVYLLGNSGGALTQASDGDVLIGGSGDDILSGVSGDVFLYGGPVGANTLESGQARAFMHGGQGAVNRFRLQQTNGNLSYLWGFGGDDVVELAGVLNGFSGRENDVDKFVRIAPSGKDGILWLSYDGTGSDFVPLAWIVGGSALSVTGLGERLVIRS